MAGSQQSRQTTKPWKEQRPYLEQLYSQAGSLFGQGAYNYGPDRVAGFGPTTQQAFGLARDYAIGDNPLRSANRDLTQRTLAGEFLGSNPYTANVERQVQRGFYDTVNSLGTSFEAAGRSGAPAQGRAGGLAEENLAQGLGTVRFGLHEAERDRQMRSQETAFMLDEQNWRNLNALASVGQQEDAMRQAQLEDRVARYNQEQYGTAEKLAEFSSMLGQPVMVSHGSSFGWNIG